MTETTHKAWGGALAAMLSALVPLIVATLTGDDIQPAQIERLADTLGLISTLGIGAVIGFIGVYYAPKNKPLD